jgi:hypothetical protein
VDHRAFVAVSLCSVALLCRCDADACSKHRCALKGGDPKNYERRWFRSGSSLVKCTGFFAELQALPSSCDGTPSPTNASGGRSYITTDTQNVFLGRMRADMPMSGRMDAV